MSSFLIFFITSGGNTPFNYFTRLAAAFIDGRLYLTENPSWLSELIPYKQGEYFVPYSPMPAVVALPFVALFGSQFPQQIVAHVVGAAIAVCGFLLARTIKQTKGFLVWATLLSSVGTIMWFEASVGSSWYLGQITAALFLFLGLLFARQKSAILTGMCLGAAYLSRAHTILSFPIFLYLLSEDASPQTNLLHPKSLLKQVRPLIKLTLSFAVGVLPFFLFNAWYNFARFGVFWDKGYELIPNVLNEPWFAKGIFHPSYIPENLKTLFGALPLWLSEKPYIQPSWYGLAIWITTPAFIFSFFAPVKKWLTRFLWLSIFPILLVVIMHGSNGFAQFGYRFAIDFYPFLLYLTLLGVARQKLRAIHWIFLFLSIAVNLWGVIWINRFGWVSF